MKALVCSVLVFGLLISLLGCGPGQLVEQEEAVPLHTVVIEAAFTPLHRGGVYDLNGALIETVDGNGDGTVTFELSAGIYLLNLLDDRGNFLFDEEGRMRFAPRANIGELVLSPYWIASRPLAVLHLPPKGSAVHAIHTMGSTWDARNRVVWEAARAMVGPDKATGYEWKTTKTYAYYDDPDDLDYNYLGEDPGAWARTLHSYYPLASCWYGKIEECHVSLLHTPENPAHYTCQGSCPSDNGKYRGGQCKAFTNLVLYRSGVYHRTGSWDYKKLPHDNSISQVASLLTSNSLSLGDVLRRLTSSGAPHAGIVVRILSSTEVVFFDSNWIDGDGNEIIGSHVMDLITAGPKNGTVNDLDTYYDLDCVYKSGSSC